MSNTGLEELLQKQLDIYKINVERIPENERKGKYKIAFAKQREKITETAWQLVLIRCVDPFWLRANTTFNELFEFQQMVTEIGKKHSKHLLRDFDAHDYVQGLESEYDSLVKYIVFKNHGAVKGYFNRDSLCPENYQRLFGQKKGA